MITLYTFGWVPPFAKGLVRDLRVRWALEESGIPYRVRTIGEGADEVAPADYRALQPFGQVPAIEDDGATLFESAAIVQHIADKGGVLDVADRIMVNQWSFAAMNTVEPHVANLVVLDLFYVDEEWAKARRPGAVELAQSRLHDLEAALGDREWLADAFSVADILMVTVLRLLRHTDMLAGYPGLVAYKERAEARPAFQRALADQMALHAEPVPA
ncbi:glutathione S-transferase family protein [Sphingomonas cavernae]|uniref:Glutathione S-transferase family protein n=1 Tax=Sphingomonas cavernae TaxID=2320861 RepID=A0A418WMU3_9SPHN|nr:glutathione S-transferase family protein [Sphingomonas cavernae]RJF91324.1 glutathione S-transferase family protein [Sphingomonas cavernae]